MFRLCPDRFSVFTIENKMHNFFEFSIEKWIAEVFFENFMLKVEKNELNGKHPLLEKENYRYEKVE